MQGDLEKKDNAAAAWISFDRWPDPLSLETFAADILRLSGAETGEEKAIALYRWVNRVFRWGGPYSEWTSMGWHGNDDLIKILAVHGAHYCDGWGRLSSALWNAGRMGAPVEKLCVWVTSGIPGHTMTELIYEDNDGIERPHAFDIFHQVAARTRDGRRFASFEDIQADQELWGDNPTDPLLPWYYRPSQREGRNNTRYSVPCHGILMAPKHDLRHRLRPGTTATRYFEPLFTPYRIHVRATEVGVKDCHSVHDPESVYLEDGSPRDPVNEPFWRPYLKACEKDGCELKGKPVRWYGSGEIIVRPPLESDASLAAASSNELLCAGAEKGRLVQRVNKQLACFVLPIECPYILTEGTLSFSYVKKDPKDWVGVGVSADGGTGLSIIWSPPLEKADRPVKVEIPLNLAEFLERKPSVYGRYSVYFRFELLSHSDLPKGKKQSSGNCWLEDIEFRGAFAHNHNVSPRLMPGNNRFVLTGGSPEMPVTLELEWEEKGKRKRFEVLSCVPSQSESIAAAGEHPFDIRMKRVTLKA